MRKGLKAKLRKAAEGLGWSWEEDADTVELEKWSPAGEDIVVTVSKDDVVGGVRGFSNGFDTEEHITELLEAKRNGFGGVPDVKTLVEDADAIQGMLGELAMALEEVEAA